MAKASPNSNMKVSADLIAATCEIETFVPFVYDDARPVRGTKYGYLPWDGGEVRGHLTIGYGHTDDAKHPLKCELGVTVTELQARQILDVDMDECEEDVRRLVKVPLTQGQFDTLSDFQFNAGALGNSTLLRKLNAGDYAAVPGELEKYIYTTIKTKDGLKKVVAPGLKTARRPMEIRFWNMAPVVDDDDDVHEPAGNVVPDAPADGTVKPLAKSKTIWGLIIAFIGTVLQQAQAMADKVEGLMPSLLPYAPWIASLFLLLTIVGFGWAAFGRWDLNRRIGA